jgi:Holliday junction resolvase
MTEQQIQKKRIDQLEAEGYYVLKLMKTNKNGIPDVLAIPPGAPVIFSEIKTPKGRLSKIQEYRLKELQKFNFKTEVYNGTDTSDSV